MVTDAQKDAMLNKLIWSANRGLRVSFVLVFCFGIFVEEGIFGRGWEVGTIEAVVAAILLVVLELIITSWKNMAIHGGQRKS